ncbi:hypothetical protein [Bacillus sp. TH13]|uniref:hypothetical protein n=1 Tax=Bacillus sp. TH13 TaxID=2796379 RepID=UPI00320A6A3C
MVLPHLVGTFDYKAKSTAEQFLAKPSVITSYEVHFYDQDKRKKMDCFDTDTESKVWIAAIEEHGNGIQKIEIKYSNRTRAEFLVLD